MLTPEQVNKQKKLIDQEIAKLEMDIELLRLDIEKLQLQCPHERRYSRSYYDGSTDVYCSDCGKEVGGYFNHKGWNEQKSPGDET